MKKFKILNTSNNSFFFVYADSLEEAMEKVMEALTIVVKEVKDERETQG